MATVTKTTKKPTRVQKPRAEKNAASSAPLGQVYSMKGEKLSTVSLPAELFAAPWRSDLVHQVTTAMQANARQNRAHTKDRSEVSGGGKKPWKQKGTGQARHGSSRSPIWRHGGITFGPRNERNYSEKINKKMRNGALASILSQKAKDGELILVDAFDFSVPKTAEAKKSLMGIATAFMGKKFKHNKAALIALASYNGNAIKSFRNMGNVATEEVRSLSPLNVLSHKYLVIEKPEAAFQMLLSRFRSGK
jgi:large subunit ribosomal protein L4